MKTLRTMQLWSLCYRLLGVLLCPFLNAYCLLMNKDNYPKWAFYLDNKEDGFTGNRHLFVDSYFNKPITRMNKFVQWAVSVWWCWRNMSFNHRYHPKCSVNITNPQDIVFEGNTYHHGVAYSFHPHIKDRKWYKITATYDGIRLTSTFSFTPKLKKKFCWKKFSFYEVVVWKYERDGLKIYPNLYFDSWWLEKIKQGGWPKHKTRGVFARIRRTKHKI